MKLHIAPDLSLPIDAVTEKFAFLGRTGSGKTYAAMKLAEEMLIAKAQIVAIDPVGVWYGLRIAGAGPGFPIHVFGGLHGDVPIEPTGGALLADLVVDRGISAVLDVSQFETDANKARFAKDFAARFFFRKKAAPSAVHIFLEECQEFVPQNPQGNEADMLHAFSRMLKLGRNFGIGASLSSQRPQEVNKKALNMTEVMLAFQMTGIQERETLQKWVVDKGLGVNLKDELPGVKRGCPYLSSPQWLDVFRQIEILPKRTADVSSTPKVGAAAAESKPLLAVDLENIRTAMAATIEKAKAEDPRELRRQIADLQKQLSKPAQTVAPTTTKGIDPERLKKEFDRGHAAGVAAERKRLKPVITTLAALQKQVESIAGTVSKFDVAGLATVVNEFSSKAPIEPVDERPVSTVREIRTFEKRPDNIRPNAKTHLPTATAIRSPALVRKSSIHCGNWKYWESSNRNGSSSPCLRAIRISPAPGLPRQ